MNIKSLFIGPKAENISIYEELIVDIVRDAGYKRKNFFPSDDPLISEKEKLSDSYLQTKAELMQLFYEVNAKLKEGVPTYHPRHIGHMFGDLLIPSLVGYFSTMLNNSNNVVGEVSPVTTEMELKFAEALSEMIGYNVSKTERTEKKYAEVSWGHITNGGTTANIEALWLARNLKYFPISIKLLSFFDKYSFFQDFSLKLPSGNETTIKQSTFQQLFNLSTQHIYELLTLVYTRMETKGEDDYSQFNKDLELNSVQGLGVAGIHQNIRERGEELALPKVYVTKTAHYSWKKAMDILGLGKKQLVNIKVDENFRLDIQDLKENIKNNSPVLAVVSVMGSTEEGVIDPLHKIICLKEDLEKNNFSFYIHIDAAYGGYFLALLKEKSGIKNVVLSLKEYFESLIDNKEIGLSISKQDVNKLFDVYSFDKDWFQSIVQSHKADSITIDPHKLGYVPYPAGAVVYKNDVSKYLLAQNAPYLASVSNPKPRQMFLGKWSIEGSRPGASATACYMASKIVPLNHEGYGILMASTMITTARFVKTIEDYNSKDSIFKIIPLFIPETNIFCYIVAAPTIISELKWLNIFNTTIYEKLSFTSDVFEPNIKYIVSKSTWDIANYEDNIKNIVNKAHVNINKKDNELIYLRSTFMNPLSVELKAEFYNGFINEIISIADDTLTDILLENIKKNNKGERLSILWIEDEKKIENEKNRIVLDEKVGRYLNITRVENIDKNINIKDYFLAIVDLNLETQNHFTLEFRKTGYNVIKKLHKGGMKNFIIFSTYLVNNRKMIEWEVKQKIFTGIEIEKENLIAKKIEKVKNKEKLVIKELVNRIFYMVQKADNK